jgi:hypothetical protein
MGDFLGIDSAERILYKFLYGSLFLLLLSLLVAYLAGSARRLPREQGETPLHHEWTGGYIEPMYLSWGLIRFSIYTTFLVISYGLWPFRADILLYFRDVTGVRLGRTLIARGVCVEHSRKDIPAEILIWSRNPRYVKALIEERVTTTAGASHTNSLREQKSQEEAKR